MKIKTLSAILMASVFVAACGGGGGGPAGNTGIAPTPVIVPPEPPAVVIYPSTLYPSTLLTTTPSQPVLSALVGVEEIAAFNRLNEHRAACGFGYLQYDPLLTQSIDNHTRYLAAYESFGDPHTEIAGRTGFTGVSSSDRATAVGYKGSAGETLYFRGGQNKTGAGVQGVRTLMAAPYHMSIVVGHQQDIGFAVRSTGPLGTAPADLNSIQATIVMVGANTGSRQGAAIPMQASNDVLTYPCQGTTDVAYNLISEYPNPTAYLSTGPRNLERNPIGHPIYVRLRPGRVLAITSPTVTTTDASGIVSNVELLPILTAANDANKSRWVSNEAVIIPANSLAKNTVHTVTIKGTNNGVEFTKTFQFTTGSAENSGVYN